MSASVPGLFNAVYGIVPAMAVVNFVVILSPGKHARAAWGDYRRQRIAKPAFARHTIPARACVLPAGADALADPRIAARES
ncbi:hypothetical protein [Burkholderia vietnamiensis]|uniref:hypothetical protein n=1 Tax=Burkholderia vietnamiensis TaxID=60552 RepID=UPI00158D1D07|nr:hypothetical protein [Burkholderia vietnamiensis]HDR8958901.1 hypothetical protein [Burkholderia vietnamiensis]HDR9049398.1 hypothetical protein [Burkholderia vietnamiensis]HDR9234884.1 hypothetical protein [Burkholderia vietnamiensis]HDR9245158.1 hypothetical protein [Burkholderia vietnamiensis]